MTWSRTMPTDPGHYWVRDDLDPQYPLTIVFRRHADWWEFLDGGGIAKDADVVDLEFWSERIEPPALLTQTPLEISVELAKAKIRAMVEAAHREIDRLAWEATPWPFRARR